LSNRTKDFLKSPRGTFIRIEGLVVLAAAMLIFLAISGSWRRKRRCLLIRYAVMGAYTVSSSLVTYLLGSMQSVFREVKSSMYPIWAVRLMSMASACLIPVIASLTLSGVIKAIPSGVKGGAFLDTTEADVAITVAMLVCIALLEVLQLLHYRTTIWGRVSLACQCVRDEQALMNKRQRGRWCMKFKEILAKVGMSAPNDHYYFEEKLGQYSLLESVIYHPHQNQSKYGLWISFWYKCGLVI
jgi:hypothetical protein